MSRLLKVRGMAALLAGLCLCGTAWATELPEFSTHYSPQRDPFADGDQALALAQDSGRGVLIEVGGDWCRWCHVLERFLERNEKLKERLHEVFVVLKVNVSEDNDNAAFMEGLPPVRGYPHLFVTDARGRVLQSQDTLPFLADGGYSVERFEAFLEHWWLRLKVVEREHARQKTR